MIYTESERPLRIAHLTTVDMSLALLLETELRAGSEAGHEMLAISAPGSFLDRIATTGARFIAVPGLTRRWSIGADLRAAGHLYRVLRAERPDVVHTHTPKAGVIGRVVGRVARVPAIVNTVHGLWTPVPGARLGRMKARLADAIEAVASLFSDAELYQNADDHARLRWIVGTKGEVVGNGVDLERFRFSAGERDRIRAEWSVPDDAVLVIGVGRQVAEKGIHEFVEAARSLQDQARFVWVGAADADKADAVTDLDDAIVTRVGMRADMVAVYSAADVFVLPSWREGFSRAGMEAAACGRALVLSDIRGCREVGRHGVEALLVPPREPARLAAAIAELVDDPERRSRLGVAAAERARVAFDQRAVAAMSRAAYRRVLARRREDGAER